MYLKPSRRKKARMRTTTIIVAAAAAAAVVLLLFLLGVFPAVSLGSNNIRTLDRLLPDNVTASDNGFLYTENNKMILADAQGVETWSLDLNIPEAQTAVSPSLICNYAGRAVQVMRYTKEQLFSTSIDKDILSAAAGEEYVALLTTAQTENGALQYAVYLFDQSGQQTGQLDFASRQVLGIGFFSDSNISDLFWSLSLDTSGVTPISYITMYNKATGEMTYSISIPSRIVEQVYVTSNLIFASGTNYLTAYTYFGDIQSEQMVYGWHPGAVSLTQSAVRLAYVPRQQTVSIDAAQIYAADGANSGAGFTDLKINLPQNVFSVAITQNRLYAFTSTTVSVYLPDGSLEKVQNLGAEITKVKQVSDNYAILWDMQKSYIMRLA